MPDVELDRQIIRALGGRRIVMLSHHPLVLDNPRRMWLVLSGEVTVMTTRVSHGLPVGPRRRVFDAGPGTPLFPVSDGRATEAQRLIVVSSGETVLAEVPLKNASELLLRVDLPLPEAIGNWASKLSEFAARGEVFAGADRFPHDGKFQLSDGMLVGVERERIGWLRVEEGELYAFGDARLRIGKIPIDIPVGGSLWFQARGDTKVLVHDALTGAASIDFIRGLALFNSLLQIRLAQFEDEDESAARARLNESAARERQALQGGIRQLTGVLHKGEPPAPRATPLLTVAALIGDTLGIAIKGPAQAEDMRLVKEPIEAIARASRVRYRTVLLAGRWWEQDCGPLIGFINADHRPVALRRRRWGGYSIYDPAIGREEKFTEAHAVQLEAKGIMLYPRLPDAVNSLWGVARHVLAPRLPELYLVLALSTIITLVGMVVPQATGLLMDNAIPDANRRLVGELALAMLTAALGAGALSLAQGIVNTRISAGTDASAQALVWDRVLGLRPPTFRQYSSGDLLDRVLGISRMVQSVNGQVMQSLLMGTTSTLNLGLMFYYSGTLATGAFALGMTVALVTFAAGYFARRHYRRLMELQGRFFGFVVELVNAVSKIRVAAAERRAYARWAERYAEQLRILLKGQEIEDAVSVLNAVVPLIASIIIFWLGVALLEDDAGSRLTVGGFLAFNAAMGLFLTGVTTLSITLLDLLDVGVMAERVRPLLEAATEIDDSLRDPGRLSGAVEFKDVHFGYTVDGPKILKGVSFTARPEEFIAFVGPSGSGKSTIFRLLLGFEQPDAGRIMLGGADLQGLDITLVRRQLGVVLQNARINAGSLFDNIAVSAAISLDEAWIAAEDAGFAEDIRGMPMGMHTMISEGGTNLSGGQRQRLLIARALVRNPRLLLFDEATSALDNRTQAIVSAALQRRKVTRIVIAHRLSTIRHADRIYVLADGRIVETGRFDDLVALNGVFASMMARQSA